MNAFKAIVSTLPDVKASVSPINKLIIVLADSFTEAEDKITEHFKNDSYYGEVTIISIELMQGQIVIQ